MTEPATTPRGTVPARSASPFPISLPRDPVTIAILLIIGGVLLRVLVAGVLLPMSGFRIDVGDFTAWAQRLAASGPGSFYDASYFADYPPGYLYVLWFLGSIGQALKPITLGVDITAGLVKVPGIMADAGVAWMLFAYSRRFLDRRFFGWSGTRIGLVALAIYLFNPATLFDSAVWGQIDSVGTLVLLATLYFLARGWTEAASVGAVVALLVKFQFAFVIPIVAIVGIKRHLFGRSSDPERDGHPDSLRVLTSLAAGLGTLVLLILPFGMTLWSPDPSQLSLIGKFDEATKTYAGLTINAFNLWRNPWSGLGDQPYWGCDVPSAACTNGAGVAFVLGSYAVSWQLVGTVLFAAAALIALWHVARRDDAVGILDSALLLAVAFFAVPTRVHERYLFPALALAAPLVARGWRWMLIYGALALSVFANVYWVYTADWSFVQGPPLNPGVNGEPMARDPFLAATVFSDWGIYLLSFMIVVVLVILASRAAGLAWSPIRSPLLPRPRSAPPAPEEEVASALPPPPMSEEPARAPGWLTSVRDYLRPDRSDPYLREPMRRLDRIDLAILVGLVVFSFLFRLWRLDTPRSMHFDEVYHARSATEWLADWEHGWKRDTYEWTHPMLAKYLIAAGIVFADPNKVVGSTDLDQPAAALAVSPQRTASGRPASIVFAGVGSTITARDAVSGDLVSQWTAPGVVTALAYDETNERLLAATAADGHAWVYDLSAFVTARGERAPPPPVTPIDTGLSGILQIDIPPTDQVALFRGPDGIVITELVTGAELGRSDLVAGGVAYLPPIGDASSLVVATDMTAGTLVVLDGATLQPAMTGDLPRVESLPAPPAGPVLVRGSGNDAQVWVPVGALPAAVDHPAVEGGITVFDEAVNLIDTAPLPGRPTLIAWESVVNMIYVAGFDTEAQQPAIWTVQPLGNGGRQSAGFAAFDTTLLPGDAQALAIDTSDHSQDDDHALLLVSTAAATSGATGVPSQLVRIDAGSNAFAWRIAGVLFGSILVALIYLLAATMFRRRRIAVLAGLFMAFDAMSYVMSRISMNDIFVAAFIAAAYLVFWQVWSGRWQRSAWWALPLVGVLIGLASASKWVGIYALVGLWVLVLARSHLGRFLLVAGIAGLTVVAGIGAPWPFLAICLVALALALVLVSVKPIRLTGRDLLAIAPTALVLSGVGLAFALAFDQVQGAGTADNIVELVFAVLARGAQVGWPAFLMLGVAGVLLLWRAVLSLLRPESDRRWHLPGEMAGFSWPWIWAALAVLPLLVYFLCYIPYLQLGHNIAGPDAGPGYGWSLEELHAQMFGYHFGLQAGHPASSPWWSWPLDLKPVWFYGHDFDNRTIGVIYNGGNPILFWAGVPALLYIGVQAWRRRSAALVLIVAAFAFQFLPWTRIERATFQYHYLTAVMFAMIAVAYVVDEGLRSWSWRPLATAFLVLAVIAGVLVFPLGSAIAMPDWYINFARALPPWNYAFQFPNPPQGDRGQLLSAATWQLALGVVAALGAAAFALFGRDRWGGGSGVAPVPPAEPPGAGPDSP
jgi:predicted membrane-bound dolichyl-phosphate-mannose-protein mannosyltransferase